MQIAKLRILAGLDSQQPSSVTSDLASAKSSKTAGGGGKTPVTPLVIPVKRVGADDKKTASGGCSGAAAAADDVKPARKLFSVSAFSDPYDPVYLFISFIYIRPLRR